MGSPATQWISVYNARRPMKQRFIRYSSQFDMSSIKNAGYDKYYVHLQNFDKLVAICMS